MREYTPKPKDQHPLLDTNEMRRTIIVGGATPLSFEVFKKTPEEKLALKKAKASWVASMRVKDPTFTKRQRTFDQSFISSVLIKASNEDRQKEKERRSKSVRSNKEQMEENERKAIEARKKLKKYD
jgi:hypothetical protein